MKILKLFILLIIVSIISCNHDQLDKSKSSIERYWESLDSTGFSVYLGNIIKEQKIFENSITADLESDVVECAVGVDAAEAFALLRSIR